MRLTPEIATKLGMVPGEWFRNACLWELYSNNPGSFDNCESLDEAISKGLIPKHLDTREFIDLNSF